MITHDHKIIFIHIPKCAGRSVCDMFKQRFDHYTANYMNVEYQPAFAEYHKFTIVRNPFDRLVSLYIYIKNHRRHLHERIAVTPGVMLEFNQWLKINIENFQGSFLMDSAEGQRGTDGDLGSSFWFSSQKRRISDYSGKIIIPTILKLEDGTKPVEELLYSITGVNAHMPHVNASEYDDYRKFYNTASVKLLQEFQPVIDDCEAFNYSF